jgi:quercetin dioxygenase-like cupin family protein
MLETVRKPVALAPGAGDAVWFIDNLATIKVFGQQTDGRAALLELEGPEGHMPPLHVHLDDDEIFYVLDGEFTFYVGDQKFRAVAGTTVLAPCGIPHTFRIESATGRWLVIGTPGGFDEFVAAVGTPATAPIIPDPPLAFDPAKAPGVQYRVEILGPPGTLPSA